MSDALRQVVEFVDSFAADEHAARIAMYTEPDDERYRALEGRAAAHLESAPGSILTLGFGRGSGPAAQKILDRPEHADAFSKRSIFLVTEHETPSGPAFRALVSDPTDAEGRYLADALHIRMLEGRPRIVGRAAISPFGDDDGIEWEPMGGDQLEGAGPAVDVVKLRRPLDSVHAAFYDAIVAGGAT
jgi:hypothetical protein